MILDPPTVLFLIFGTPLSAAFIFLLVSPHSHPLTSEGPCLRCSVFRVLREKESLGFFVALCAWTIGIVCIAFMIFAIIP